MIMRPVIISRSNQPVTTSNPVTVHTGDTLLNLPLRSETMGCEDERVHPEEDQPADQVCDNGSPPRSHRCEKNTDHGKLGSACLSPEQIDPEAFVG